MHSVGGKERAAAVGSLLLGTVAVLLMVDLAAEGFPRGLVVVGFLVFGAILAGLGVIARGLVRVGLFCLAGLVVGFTLGVLVENTLKLVEAGLAIGLFLVAFALSREAFSVRVPLPDASDPGRPVLIFNPKSGGGKAEESDLSSEAEARGYKTVELTKGADLRELVLAEWNSPGFDDT